METNLIDATESARLDDLTAYNSTILYALSLEQLEAMGARAYGRPVDDLRESLLCNSHPDDLAGDLARAGHTLASVGIVSISVSL